MGFIKDWKEKKREEKISRTYRGYPDLLHIKPSEGYEFHSDYFKVDDSYCTILTLRHNSIVHDNFCPFWGINLIPTGLDQDVVTVNLEQISRMSAEWIESHQTKAEDVAINNVNEVGRTGTYTGQQGARQSEHDIMVIASELASGASYLNVQERILVKAPTLESLERAVARIKKLYQERFATVSPAPHEGCMRNELSHVFGRNKDKKGKGFYFTSTEFAGAYNLVTHGLEDKHGEYVGRMTGDVNNSAVIFDVDKYRSHVVIATSQNNSGRMKEGLAKDIVRAGDMWGSKLGQACLLNGGKVVHLLLESVDMDDLGPKFESITHIVNMNQGDINMFEMFGEEENELSIYPTHMQKLILMAEQAYETNDSDRAVIRGELEAIATKFYVEQKMWHENAVDHRDLIRIVNIPHAQVPRLQMFVSYLETEYKAATNTAIQNAERVHALSVLRATFKNLLSANGDLFNTQTSSVIDNVAGARRVIYDFGSLMERGKGVAMAQLVNVIGLAVSQLSRGDLIVIHGADLVDVRVREYVESQLSSVRKRGGRVAYLYNDVESCLDNKDFNRFDTADYTLFGPMSDNQATRYQELLGREIPPDLVRLITDKATDALYVRRGYDNVVFVQELQLDIIKNRKRKGMAAIA